MTARELEDALLSRCAAAALGATGSAQDQREANVFRIAALLIQSQHAQASRRLMKASMAYFSQHPHEQLIASDVIKNGWLISLPRARDMLERRMN